jgi:Cu/Ag efflux protein CusF
MRRLLTFLILAGFVTGIFAKAQEVAPDQHENQANTRPNRPEEGRRFRGVFGTITEISSSGLKLKLADGSAATVQIGQETQFRKERQLAKLSDFKEGDNVIVRGDPVGDNAWKARMVASAPNPADAQARFREGLGKQFVIGQIKTVDPPKITVQRVDGVEQTLEADENTSFKRRNESITLPDLKPGDTIFARGELKDGVFLPSDVRVVDPEMAARMKERGGMFLAGGAGRNRANSDASQQSKPDVPKQ